MKVTIYGPSPEPDAIAAILKLIPAGSTEVLIKAPLRNSIDRRPCQQPNWLLYDAVVDSKYYINLVQESPTAPFRTKQS